jgi:transcriptional regulator with XRE-family HTH domain
MKDAIGKVLREARQHAGLTQQELADRIGKSKQAISRAEYGHHYPSLPTILDLARACGISPAQIFVKVADEMGEECGSGKMESLYREINLCHSQLTEAGVPSVKTVELSLSERISLLAERTR